MVAMGEQNKTLQTRERKQYIPSRLKSKTTISTKIIGHILSYGSEIWDFMEESIYSLELSNYIISNNTVYSARSFHSNQHRCTRRTRPATYPSHMERKIIKLRYWDRLCSNDIPMLLKYAVSHASRRVRTVRQENF